VLIKSVYNSDEFPSLMRLGDFIGSNQVVTFVNGVDKSMESTSIVSFCFWRSAYLLGLKHDKNCSGT